MNSENSSVVMSNELQPTQPGVEAGHQAVNSHISQIPGLSPSIKTPPEQKARGRRVAVLDSDSDYVKLAKQGGHKGLLWHQESNILKTNSYKPPDWFAAGSGDISDPSLINSEEKKNPGAFQPLEPPFGTDNMSAWERDNNSSNEKEKSDILGHDSQMEKLQTLSQSLEVNKFKRIAFDKKPAPVDMSKLLSFGYAEENKPVQ
ncbi:uncharacterized protein C7orf57 homolog isoform X2 [Stegastes partitus]|uniref:Uncharacterized protein C7orf57 homolog isoform X2 n=1 Tax=Stegastes partitus TaxID=144197 RepID=A0A9Y4NBP7_9TELE|nr:PREDICTED: uncharacterized protein C7orf57 homolog isoform X2 [Stegastes partitus]